MKRTLIAGALTLAMLTGAAAAAGPVILPQDIAGGSPSGITVVEQGGYLLTDTFNKVVWQVAPDGSVTRLAGQIGVKGLDGVPIGRYTDGTLDTAFFLEPWDICPVLDGWAVSDAAAHVVRYIGEAGVQTLVGSGKSGSVNGVGIKAQFDRPTGLAVDDQGRLYIADTGLGEIRRMDKKGKVTTVLTGLSDPTGLCWFDGALYIAETGAHRICRWQDGKLTTLVGGEEGDTDGLVQVARLNGPQDVAVDSDGTVYIADTGNGCIRRLAAGQVTTVMDLGELNFSPIMPRSLAILDGQLLITDPFATTVLELETERQITFSDVTEDMWYYGAVNQAGELGLIHGMGDGSFAPENLMTRAQFVTMLGNLAVTLDGGTVINGNGAFQDVPESLWCAAAVNWAAEQGIAAGTGDKTFSPDMTLTRQQMVTFLWRFAAQQGKNVDVGTIELDFSDGDQVEPYAQEAMSWAVESGLIQGDEGRLKPADQATRAHGAQVLVRFMDWLQREA